MRYSVIALLWVVVGCGGSDGPRLPECARWCGGGTEYIAKDIVTCVTACGARIQFARYSELADCDAAKQQWLDAIASCH